MKGQYWRAFVLKGGYTPITKDNNIITLYVKMSRIIVGV